MNTYTVILTWLTVGRRGSYGKGSKTIKVQADDILTASQKALATVQGKICPAVSCIWLNWSPEPAHSKPHLPVRTFSWNPQFSLKSTTASKSPA